MSPEAKVGTWIVAGLVGVVFWLVLLDGFAAGALLVLTVVAAFAGAFFAWLEGQDL
jgi:hypothetical protein